LRPCVSGACNNDPHLGVNDIERHYSHYRSPDGIQIADNIVVAKFDHVTSRAIGPQLHSHCFLINAVMDRNGAWKANEPFQMFKDQKFIGFLYRCHLSRRLQVRGYSIEFTDREQMLFEIKGVEQGLIAQFSQRRKAIVTQVELWKASGKHEGVREARLYEMAVLQTRAKKNSELTKKDVEQIWRQGFEAAGTSPEQVKMNIEAAKSTELPLCN